MEKAEVAHCVHQFAMRNGWRREPNTNQVIRYTKQIGNNMLAGIAVGDATMICSFMLVKTNKACVKHHAPYPLFAIDDSAMLKLTISTGLNEAYSTVLDEVLGSGITQLKKL